MGDVRVRSRHDPYSPARWWPQVEQLRAFIDEQVGPVRKQHDPAWTAHRALDLILTELKLRDSLAAFYEEKTGTRL